MACAETMKKYTTDNSARGDIYQDGPHKVQTVNVDTEGSICCPLMVAIPKDEGDYPVVQFQHGTWLQNTDYKDLIYHVASWGFIVVAPQMYNLLSFKPDATTEIKDARAILNWLPTGLMAAMPKAFAKHRPDFEKLALVGHSRGGLVVFGLASNVGNSLQQYSAVVGLDPVDASWPLGPLILKHEENSLDVGVPTLIVGTGLGPSFPACAPRYQGHENFYRDVSPPSFHFVASKHGHMDFLNDCTFWQSFKNPIACKAPCRGGPSRQPMRRFGGGILVAFLRNALLHNSTSLDAALTQSELAPVPLDPPESKGKIRVMPTLTNSTSANAHQYAIV